MESLNKINEAHTGVMREMINLFFTPWIENEENPVFQTEICTFGEHAVCQAKAIAVITFCLPSPWSFYLCFIMKCRASEQRRENSSLPSLTPPFPLTPNTPCFSFLPFLFQASVSFL